ncbi:MAG: hypothetical protein II217_04825 [Alistipes sp.]|jgi:hypothetical protein|nr:hypothetical protein [Alistipes sp.]MBR5483435.1 hypothetical protein [Alistipes sp.]
MIKRIIGALFAFITIAVIVLVAINFGNYKSLLPADLFSAQSVEAAPAAETADVAPADNASEAAEESAE